MPKATITVCIDSPEEVEAVQRWLEKWEPHLKDLSGNLGCGCCVDMFNVEGPQEALDELPEQVLANSKWTNLEWFA